MPRRLLPWVALAAATLALFAPYLGARLVSGNGDHDALAYLAVVADAVEQGRHGYWPAYVGQSELRPNGGLYPQAQAPGLSLLAVLLDALTGRTLAATSLLNLAVVLAALAGAGSMYAVLRRLVPGPAWAAAGLAFGYAACPGVLGVLVRLDMVTSFLTLPALPWLWLGLVRALRGDPRGGVLAGLALAALWTLHAPVALWATTAAAIGGLAGSWRARRGARAGLTAVVTLACGAAWTITGAFTLAGGRAGNVGVGGGVFVSGTFVERVMTTAGGDVAGALLPLGWVRGHPFNGWPWPDDERRALPAAWREGATLPYLQLGYLSWAALGLGLLGCLRAGRAPRGELAGLLTLALPVLLLVLLLFPVPGLTRALWGALPGIFEITKWWPMQRLYVVLASLAAPLGWMAWHAAGPWKRPRGAALALVLLVAWSGAEAWKLERLALQSRELGAWIARPENLPLRVKDLQMSAPVPLPEYPDAALHLRIVDGNGRTVADNLTTVTERCRAEGKPVLVERPDVGRVDLLPGERQLLCLAGPPPRDASLLQVSGAGLYRHLRLTGATSGPPVLPLFASAPIDGGLAVRPLPEGLRSWRYEREALPVRVEGWLPFRARLVAPQQGLFLETARQRVAGYRARVNGRAVAVTALRSGGPLVVPLDAGENVVELDYEAPLALRATGWLSLLTLAVGLALGVLRPRTAETPLSS